MTAPIIALLDSDPAFLTAMHDLLTGEGYRPLRWCACAGVELLPLLRDARPDLVIVDLDLGGERRGGWEVLMRLWGDCETTDIPAIVLTGAAAMPPVRGSVLRAMRCRGVPRPFAHGDLRDLRDLCELLAAIEDALRPSPARRAPEMGSPAGTYERVPTRGGHRSRGVAGGGCG